MSSRNHQWHRVLLGGLLVLLVLTAAQRTEAAPVCNVLWTLNGNADDATGNNNYGTVSNWSWGGNVSFTNTATLGGVTQTVATFSSGASIDKIGATGLPTAANAAWTMNFWAQLNSVPVGYTHIAGFGAGLNAGPGDHPNASLSDARGAIAPDANNFTFFNWGSSGQYVYSGAGFDPNSTTPKWHMYTIAYDGANISMYVDSVKKGATTAITSMATAPSNLHLGGRSVWGKDFAGSLANFSVWTGAMNTTEIAYLLANPQTTTASAPFPGLTWTGSAGSGWSTTGNWSPSDFTDDVAVRFTDTPSNTTVDISAADVAPSSVLFDNSAKDYTLQGSHGITGGASLALGGSAKVTITNANSYSGGTTLTGGATLNIHSNAALGATPGSPTTNLTFASTSKLQFGADAVALDANRSVSMANGATVTMDTNGYNATINGAISGTGSNLVKIGSGTLNLAGAVSAGPLTVSNGGLSLSGGSASFTTLKLGNTSSNTITPTVNIAAGSVSFTDIIGFGNAAGSRGVMNISGTATTVTASGPSLVFGGAPGWGNYDSSGVINQSGGTFNINTTRSDNAALLMPWAGSAYGAIVLSGGTLNYNAAAQFVMCNQNSGCALFSQTGGSTTINNKGIQINANGSGAAIVDISGGTLTNTNATGNFMAAAGTGVGILNVRGTGTVQERTGNFYVSALNPSTSVGGNGIVNLLTGGTLEVNRIQKNGTTGTANINFDGGTLKVYATNAGANFLAGLNNAFVYPGGLTVDTQGQNVTIGQSLVAPVGYGIGASGTTIPITSDGGSGYIAPPTVTFAPPVATGGVRATGVAVLDGNGTVTGILITSPGSGYAQDENVRVSYNGGSNTSNAATVAATAFTTTGNGYGASSLNTSGGLTKNGAGTLILSGTNTYTGPTIVNQGTLSISSAYLDNTAAVRVASGAYLNLGFFDTDTIGELWLGGSKMVGGTWGAPDSGAAHTSDLLKGTGLLQVPSTQTTFRWTGANGSSWINGGNWNPDAGTGGPSGSGFEVTFGKTVDLVVPTGTADLGGSAKTVGKIIFAGDVETTIATNPDTLTLENGASTASITVEPRYRATPT